MWWTDKQRHEWSLNQWFPRYTLIHTISLWRGHLSHHISRFSTHVSGKIWKASAWVNKWIMMLSCCLMYCTFVLYFLLQWCHLQQHKAHECRKQKLLSVRIWLCVLNRLHPLIWAQQKFPSIGPLNVRLSAYLSSPSPALLPHLPPSTPPPPPGPRPHWSAVPWLLPADQSAWCLLCLGEVNKLLGQSNGKRRGQESWCLALECETEKDRGMGKEGRKVW